MAYAAQGLARLLRQDKRLHGEISHLVYGLVRDFTTAASGKPIRTAAVMVFQSSGQLARWNPHWHGLFLEGGFDQEGRFLHVPTVDAGVDSQELPHDLEGVVLGGAINVIIGGVKQDQDVLRTAGIMTQGTGTSVDRPPSMSFATSGA